MEDINRHQDSWVSVILPREQGVQVANTNRGEEIAKAARQVNASVIKLTEWQKAGPVYAHTNATTVALMEEGDIKQKQVVGPCQDFIDTSVLEEDIVQFKLS